MWHHSTCVEPNCTNVSRQYDDVWEAMCHNTYRVLNQTTGSPVLHTTGVGSAIRSGTAEAQWDTAVAVVFQSVFERHCAWIDTMKHLSAERTSYGSEVRTSCAYN